MDSSPLATTLACTQCGGELHPDEGQIFITCPYCNSTVYVDKSQVVFHWFLAPTLDEGKASGSLARWMAGNQTVKDLDKKARLVGQSFEFFPVWLFKRRAPGGKEELIIEPAAATSVSEIRQLRIPAGDLRKYDPALDSQAHMPSVPLQAVMKWMEDRRIPSEEITERALVHLPLYTFKYNFAGKPYTALVEAGTGSVFANIYPAKAEAPYLLAGGVSAAVFLCLALAPVVGALVSGEDGLAFGAAICAGVGLLVAPFLFGFAAWVASKI